MAVNYTYACSLVRVTDGDTMVLTVDLGFRLTATMPVRLLGLNCPEKNTTRGKEVKAWVQQWFSDHADVIVTTEKDPEKYGRWLGTVAPVGSQRTLNAELLDGGMAKPWDGKGARPV